MFGLDRLLSRSRHVSVIIRLTTDIDYPWFGRKSAERLAVRGRAAWFSVRGARRRKSALHVRGIAGASAPGFGRRLRLRCRNAGEQHRLGRTKWRLGDDTHLNGTAMNRFAVQGECGAAGLCNGRHLHEPEAQSVVQVIRVS